MTRTASKATQHHKMSPVERESSSSDEGPNNTTLSPPAGTDGTTPNQDPMSSPPNANRTGTGMSSEPNWCGNTQRESTRPLSDSGSMRPNLSNGLVFPPEGRGARVLTIAFGQVMPSALGLLRGTARWEEMLKVGSDWRMLPMMGQSVTRQSWLLWRGWAFLRALKVAVTPSISTFDEGRQETPMFRDDPKKEKSNLNR